MLQNTNRPKKEEPDVKVREGDCRVCQFFRIPQNTGQAADTEARTKHYTVRPCGVGLCEGKKFLGRDKPKPKEEPKKDDPDPKDPSEKDKSDKKKQGAGKRQGGQKQQSGT
jgi:hypothetical protein